MRKIILGKTGAEVSTISLGTCSYGGDNKQGETRYEKWHIHGGR